MRLTRALTYPFRKAADLFTRNYAFSDSFLQKLGLPHYQNWTVKKAVKDGYKANGWVYRAVTLTSKSGASVPWGVVAGDDEQRMEDHHLDILLQHPNEHISRQDMFELWISWLELSGNATSIKVFANDLTVSSEGRQTTELWPISPDRIHAKISKEFTKWLDGYTLDRDKVVKWEPEEIIHFKYFNPAKPYWGIGPLQAAAKVVDVDVDQKDWNKSAMENQGVLSGLISMKREFDNPEALEALAEDINDRYSGKKNARKIGLLGSEAKYHRIGATPVEMDFNEARTKNRDEIWNIFGIPVPYAGGTETLIYNNYQTSELIFWFQKIIPLLDDLKDTFNLSFKDELDAKKKEKIDYFLGSIPAIRRAFLERSRTAKNLYNMGVPFDRLNKVFKFGVDKFDGWDVSYPGGGKAVVEAGEVSNQSAGERADILELIDESVAKQIEKRSNQQLTHVQLMTRDMAKESVDREEWAVEWSSDIAELLTEQQRLINQEFEDASDEFGRLTRNIDSKAILSDTWEAEWVPVYNNLVRGYALKSGAALVVEVRAVDDELITAINDYLDAEQVVLKELSHIEASTVKQIAIQITAGIEEGAPIGEIQRAIMDAGIFDPARALRLARTITGTAGSMGQFAAGKHAGGTHKTWNTSGFEVRDEHQEREGETVKIDALFTAKFGGPGPRYPLDPNIPVADRVNCRCFMTFERRT